MRKIVERAFAAAFVAGIVLTAYGLGVAGAEPAATVPAEPPALEQVHVSLTYDKTGEVESIELTDAEGQYVPVGSVAEDREAMFPAEYENTDAEEN